MNTQNTDAAIGEATIDEPQWLVTPGGLEGDGRYDIAKSDMLRLRGDLYEWPVQVCTKDWVDFEDFVRGFLAAIDFHSLPFDAATMAATITSCKKRIAESEEFDAVCREMFPHRYVGNLTAFFVSDFDAVKTEIDRRHALKAAV